MKHFTRNIYVLCESIDLYQRVLWMLKKISSNQVFIKAIWWHLASQLHIGITLEYWIFGQKYFQYLRDQMISHGFDKNLIWRFFSASRGGTLWICKKRFLQCRGGNFARKKILQNQKFLNYVQECPVKCLWMKSKIAQLSPMPI